MKGLILKDILNINKNSKTMAFLLVVFAVLFIPGSEDGYVSYAAICVFLCNMMIITTISFDDLANWDQYAMTMPVTRREMVLSKYLVMILFSVLGGVISLVFSVIIGIVRSNLNLPNVLFIIGIILCIAFLLGSLIMPLLYKFGAEKARLLTIVCFMLPTALITLSTYIFKDFTNMLTRPEVLTGILISLPFVTIGLLYLSFLATLHIIHNGNHFIVFLSSYVLIQRYKRDKTHNGD